MKFKKISFLLLAFVLINSCQKQAGEGGTSSISGKVMTIDVSHIDVPGSEKIDTLKQYYAAEKEVYIIYGDEDAIYNDSFETSWDGSFRFDFLRKGRYKLFVYSECEKDTIGLASLASTNPQYASGLINIWHPGCVNEEYPQMIEVEIIENREELKLEDIIIFNIVTAQ